MALILNDISFSLFLLFLSCPNGMVDKTVNVLRFLFSSDNQNERNKKKRKQFELKTFDMSTIVQADIIVKYQFVIRQKSD